MTREGRAREGRAREKRGAGRGGGRGGRSATGRGAGLGLRGPGSARPPRHATIAAAAVFVHLALRWGRNWAAQWHLARAVGKRFRGCRAKRLYVDSTFPKKAEILNPKIQRPGAWGLDPGPVAHHAWRSPNAAGAYVAGLVAGSGSANDSQGFKRD